MLLAIAVAICVARPGLYGAYMLRQKLKKEGIFVRDGVLWRMIDTITSDEIAQRYGYVHVERLIKAVEDEDARPLAGVAKGHGHTD